MLTQAAPRRRSVALVVSSLAAFLLLGVGVAPAPAATAGGHQNGSLRVSGDVALPASYSRADLAGLPQVTLPDQRPPTRRDAHTVTGVALQSLILSSTPLLPSAKNAGLRVTAVVTGRHHRSVAVALGELDANFGNHPALLVLARDGRSLRHAPDLTFPSDTDDRRTVHDVTHIEIAVTAPTSAAQTPGSLQIDSGRRIVVLSAARLSTLPAETRTVTFQAGTAVETHTETGPSLRTVLRAAHIRATATTTVAALGEDGYTAAVTPGETTSGGRPLQISLVEDGTALTKPRLVVDGDVKGGRYVSGLVALQVSDTALSAR